MVKVTLELSALEVEILYYCIESALGVKPMAEKEKQTVKVILKQLGKYL